MKRFQGVKESRGQGLKTFSKHLIDKLVFFVVTSKPRNLGTSKPKRF